ncbi:MAG: AAA family ATPase [Caulobacteraceae bacterium]
MLISGPPGAGKTTLAVPMAHRLGWPLITKDHIKARERVFPQTIKQDVGTLIMFAVREALSRPEQLKRVVGELIARGQVDAAEVDADDALGFLKDAPARRRWSRRPTASAATSPAPTSS